MESLKTSLQYSNSKLNNLNYSNSTVQLSSKELLSSVRDLIADDSYNPWYLRKSRELGVKRFTELATKARKSSDTPTVLFKWMLQNNQIVV